jgi:hypothetical protein
MFVYSTNCKLNETKLKATTTDAAVIIYETFFIELKELTTPAIMHINTAITYKILGEQNEMNCLLVFLLLFRSFLLVLLVLL